MERFAIVVSPQCYIHSAAGAHPQYNANGIEDEIFSGWAVRVTEQEGLCGWVKIETSYGYTGYVKDRELRFLDEEELRERQDKKRFQRIGIAVCDLLTVPKVQGLPQEYLLKSAIVEVLEKECEPGWTKVRAASGTEGYIHTVYLQERKDDDGYLLSGGARSDGYFRSFFEQQRAQMDEQQVRKHLTEHAKAYLGTQYRWGGKSSMGLDCSGLVFMSYWEEGILIYRDANILPEYPVNTITREELQPGDLIMFPGHVAMYLGEGKYIHSTAYSKTPCVTINSLNPEDPDYREDLDRMVTECGSIFAGK